MAFPMRSRTSWRRTRRPTFADPRGSDCRPTESSRGHEGGFGRLSRFGVWASSWSAEQARPLTRTVEDNALILEIIGVYDPKDPVSPSRPAERYRERMRVDIRGVRIGVPSDDWIWKDWLS